MKFKYVFLCGVLTTLAAFGLLTLVLPQNVAAAPPVTTYDCYYCPTQQSPLPAYYTTVDSKSGAQALCRMDAEPGFFCVDGTRAPGNPIVCIGCR